MLGMAGTLDKCVDFVLTQDDGELFGTAAEGNHLDEPLTLDGDGVDLASSLDLLPERAGYSPRCSIALAKAEQPTETLVDNKPLHRRPSKTSGLVQRTCLPIGGSKPIVNQKHSPTASVHRLVGQFHWRSVRCDDAPKCNCLNLKSRPSQPESDCDRRMRYARRLDDAFTIR